MNPYLIIGIILFFLAGLFGAEQYGDHARGVKDDLKAAQLKIAEDKLINDARNENDALNQELEKTHEQANAALNVLLSAPAVSVRVPTCARSSKTYPASGSSVSVTSPERTSDETQSAFNDFRQGLESDAAEWSKALNACQVVMDWAKAK